MRNKKKNDPRNKSAFVVLSETYGIAAGFVSSRGDRDMFLSYTEQVPDVSDYNMHSYWTAGGYAARLHRIGLTKKFIAPGQNWMSEVSKADGSLTQRFIATTTVDAIPGRKKIFAKPAEAKIDSIPAGFYLPKDLRQICKQNDVPANTLFQWTAEILDLDHEHRFFVADGQILTGSPYLVHGITYFPGQKSSRSSDAYEAAEKMIRRLSELDLLPPALTLDVAVDKNTDKWLIVEANPAWSSGPYGADRGAMIRVLERACNWNADTDDSRWLWEPAEYLVKKALEAKEMRIVPLSEIETASGIVQVEDIVHRG